MEKYDIHLPEMHRQKVCTLPQSNFERHRLLLFMLCIVVVQILSDISLELFVSTQLANVVISCICVLLFFCVFGVSFIKKYLLRKHLPLVFVLLVCCLFSIMAQKIALLYSNKNIALITIIICLLFRLIFWVFCSLQKMEKYKSSIRFGLLTIPISLIGVFCFYQYESIRIDLIGTFLQSFVPMFSFVASYTDLLPVDIGYFYLIADSILWYLPCISFFYKQDV